MNIDFSKFDDVTRMEEQLSKLIKIVNLSEYDVYPLSSYNKIVFSMTILSILHKELYHNEYIIDNVFDLNSKRKFQCYGGVISDIISDIDDFFDYYDLDGILNVIQKYGNEIQNILSNYFRRISTNYILQSMPLDVIFSRKKVSSFLKDNPLSINQCLRHSSLNSEELLIADILEYFDVVLSDYDDVNLIKQYLLNKFSGNKLRSVILFIICNVYQEIVDDKSESDSYIKRLFEDERLKIDDIVELFINNDLFSSECLEYFLIYNIGIYRGRLEELKRMPSHQYINRRCK